MGFLITVGRIDVTGMVMPAPIPDDEVMGTGGHVPGLWP